jgi:hypothetical protein
VPGSIFDESLTVSGATAGVRPRANSETITFT